MPHLPTVLGWGSSKCCQYWLSQEQHKQAGKPRSLLREQSKLALEMPSVIFLLTVGIPGLIIAPNISFTVDMFAGQSQGLNQGLQELPVWLFTW